MDERQDIKRLKRRLVENPDIEVWIIGGQLDHAKLCQKALAHYGVFLKKVRLFSQSKTTIDGLNPQNAIILLCDFWWKNPAAGTDAFRWYLDNAKYVMQIGEL